MDDEIVAYVVDANERNNQERVRLRTIRDTGNAFHLSPVKFKKIFRLFPEQALFLCSHLNDPILNEGTIPKYIKILGSLSFFGQGSYQAPRGEDSSLGLSQPSMSRCVTVVVDAIIAQFGEYIKFPTTVDEKEQAKAQFQEKFNIPNTLGAIDCTHVAIAKPSILDPLAPGNLFYNRKGYYSINCQIIVDAKGKTIGINPNFPGSTHDAAIWKASNINQHLEREFLQGHTDQWLLGDKGYPLLPWLMTPVMTPETIQESAYNYAHANARNVVELAFGYIKNKFRCLHRHRTAHYKPDRAAKLVMACCILYNMFFHMNDTDETDDDADAGQPAGGEAGHEDGGHLDDFDQYNYYLELARSTRQELIQNIF